MATIWNRSAARASPALQRATAIAFLLPFTQIVQIQSVGTLYLHDFVSPALLVLLVLTQRDLSPLKAVRVPLLLALIWLVGAVATDLIVGSTPENFLRGWSRIVLLAVNIATLWLLSRGDMRVLAAYMLGEGLTIALTTFLLPNFFTTEDPWKFGYGTACYLLAGSISVWPWLRRHIGPYTPSLVLALLGLVSLLKNSRSAFAIGLLAAGYSAMTTLVGSRPALARRITPVAFGAVMLGGLLFVNGLSGVYANAAVNGYLGDAARQKYIEQTAGDTSLLVGGRPELLVSTTAIADSPIIGHGSWAQDRYYSLLLWYEQRRRSLVVSDQFGIYSQSSDDRIPTHSHILGSWVEAGILSLPFWVWTIVLGFQALFSALRTRAVPSALVSIVSMLTFWDVLFSPFAADARIMKAASICVLLSAYRSFKAPQLGYRPALAGADREARAAGRPLPLARGAATRAT